MATIHVGGVVFILMPNIQANGHVGVRDQGCVQIQQPQGWVGDYQHGQLLYEIMVDV